MTMFTIRDRGDEARNTLHERLRITGIDIFGEVGYGESFPIDRIRNAGAHQELQEAFLHLFVRIVAQVRVKFGVLAFAGQIAGLIEDRIRITVKQTGRLKIRAV